MNQPPKLLTGTSALVAALAAGIPASVKLEGERIVITTAYPVDVWYDNGTIKVYTLMNDDKPRK
jgi:hypothetical protein